MTTLKLSDEQQAILDAAAESRTDLIINAVAGAGKTFILTTLVRLLRATYPSIAVVAFNNPIAAEISRKLSGTGAAVSTIHSAGHSTLRMSIPRIHLSNGKYRNLAERWINSNIRRRTKGTPGTLTHGDVMLLVNDLVSLITFTRLTLTNWIDPQALEHLNKHYRITTNDWIYPGVSWTIDEGAKRAISHHEIDYTDMIWLPYQWDARPHQYDLVLIDECQDLSNLQRGFVSRLRKPGGRIIWAGDSDQSINGFAGTSIDGFDRIRETGALEFQMNITRRCPTSHVTLAQEMVPRLRARPDAPPGQILTIKESDLLNYVKTGDLLLCRRSAPLVRTAILLNKHGIPARVLGHAQGGGGITDLLHLLLRAPDVTLENITERLVSHAEHESQRLQKRHATRQLDASQDKHAALLALVTSTHAISLSDLADQITQAFSPNGKAAVLSTIHHAKGLESDSVFILRPKLLTLTYPDMQPWEHVQEKNIRYVAFTRALQTLYYVTEPPEAALLSRDAPPVQRHTSGRQQRTRRMPGQ